MTFPLDGGPLLNGQRAVCLEAIRDITVKGHPEEEKVFVHVERRIAAVEEGEDEEDIRIRLWGNHGNGSDSGMITERRDLVFLRDKMSELAKVDNINSGNDSRIVKSAPYRSAFPESADSFRKPVPTLSSAGG
jgi:hypothetical protein